MNYKRLETKENVNSEALLVGEVGFRVTAKEKGQYELIARENEISISELLRNLARDYIFSYAISPELKTELQISNKIEAITLKNRIISSRKPSNLSHLREIFSDFEAFLEGQTSNISDSELSAKLKDFRELSNLVIVGNPFLFSKLKPQMMRIIKNKHVKRLEKNEKDRKHVNTGGSGTLIVNNNTIISNINYNKGKYKL